MIRDTTKLKLQLSKKILTDQKRIANLINNYFINIIKNLDLKYLTVSNTSDIDEIMKHFDNHISVCK